MSHHCLSFRSNRKMFWFNLTMQGFEVNSGGQAERVGRCTEVSTSLRNWTLEIRNMVQLGSMSHHSRSFRRFGFRRLRKTSADSH